MKEFLKDFFGRSFIFFVIIGIVNTIISLAIQFGLFAVLPEELTVTLFSNTFTYSHFAYWISSATAFTLTSILSFILNKKYTFQNTDSVGKTAIKFALNIAICYLLAYSLAQPLTTKIIESTEMNTFGISIDAIAMLVGQVVFTMLNYVGQKFFTFKNKDKKKIKKG